ncbi:MAG: glycosyltransferase [Nitrosomonadaceae bacterium]|nr:glycosyltransferase [Nitrosomonadaceae bacterium]|tara:strand:- start:2424 stop:3116 length:693 start_codon:yes stop_codon:yes gene_type:complete
MKVSVIVPVYNEERTIIQVLESISRQSIDGVELEVIVVDDGSFDNTPRLLEEHPDLYTKYIRQNQNSGKGGAVREGLKNSSGDYILFQDADVEYNPDDYASLLKPIILFEADLVIGSRFSAPQYTRVAYFWHRIGNQIITVLFNIINNLTFTDIYSCYVVFKREYITPENLITNGWEQQAELLAKLARKANNIYEVPISYRGRKYGEGKKIRAHHAISIIYAIIRFKIFK